MVRATVTIHVVPVDHDGYSIDNGNSSVTIHESFFDADRDRVIETAAANAVRRAQAAAGANPRRSKPRGDGMSPVNVSGADAVRVVIGDNRSVVYGGEKPPTDEERQDQRLAELRQAEIDGWQARDEIDAAHAELDRLDVPRGTYYGNRLTLATRIRYATCGSVQPNAQPRLLQEWAPEVWSGRRRFDRRERPEATT
jgi:hypothetical protein